MTANMAGPPEDSRPGELRSIARSIEPAFPDAAERLRAIAAALPTPAPEADDYVRREYDRALGAAWNALPAEERAKGWQPFLDGFLARRAAPAGEDATLTAVEEALTEIEAAINGPSGIDTRRRVLLTTHSIRHRLAQRGAADRATLAAVRALVPCEATQDISLMDAWRIFADLRSALDGPDAGGGRRE